MLTYQQAIDLYQAKIDELTDMLQRTITKFETPNVCWDFEDLDEDIKEWWEKNK